MPFNDSLSSTPIVHSLTGDAGAFQGCEMTHGVGGHARQEELHDILADVANKWSVLLIVALSRGPKRFKELMQSVDTISGRMLTQTLRELECDGLIHREVCSVMPPHVEYRLTPLGRSILGVIAAMLDWVVLHQVDVAAARKKYRPEGK